MQHSANTFYQQAVAAYQQQRLKTAEQLCQQALQKQPRHAQALHLLAILCAQTQRLTEAETYAQKAIKAERKRAEYHNTLGNILQQLGEWEAAKQSYQQAVRLSPQLADAQHNLGEMFRKLGELPLAEACFLKAVKLKPDYAEALKALGVLYEQQEQLDKAITYYEKFSKAQPQLAAGHYALGILLRRQQQLETALESFVRATEAQPDDAQAHLQAAEVCQLLGYRERALQHFYALAESPLTNQAVYLKLAEFCEASGYLTAAIEFYHRALQLEPEYAPAWLNVGVIYLQEGRLEKAQTCFERASRFVEADNIQIRHAIYVNLASAFQLQGKVDESLAMYEAALTDIPNSPFSHSNRLMNRHYSEHCQRAELFAYTRFFQQQAATLNVPNHQQHNFHTPLRVAYITENFNGHSVAFFMEAILRHHQRQRFEIFAYMHSTAEDTISERFRGYVAHWLNCTHLSDAEIVKRIQADGIDVLVDLMGHSGHNNLVILANKPAPVQITYLGYPDTTGLDAVDYRIADRYTEPEAAQIYSSETLLRMPHSYFCYQPHTQAAELLPVGDTPALRNGFVTLGSFNNYSKINDFTVGLWAETLQAVPTARMFLKAKSFNDPDTRRACLARFVAQGIDAERIEIVAYAESLGAHLQLYQKIDLCLDTHPYHGATTTCEALWMGVPVLSLQGETHVARVGQSLLTTVGLPEWAVESREEFIAKAQAFAADVDYLQNLRQGMRARLQASPLMQGEAFTRDLEALYEYAVAQVKSRICS